MNNRLHNSTNKHQTIAKRVLCVCSAGLLRSPTTANVLHSEYGFNTRAAGIVDELCLIPVDTVLVSWADEIVAVEPRVADNLVRRFPEAEHKLTVLDIPDMYEWGDPALKDAIKEQYAEKLLQG